MEIHVLYDNRRVEKFEPLMAEFRRQGIEPTRIWEPVWAKKVVESINLSHKAIVQYAKDKRLKEVCICEDDLMFTSAGAWDYFIKNKPDDFDIYVGGTYLIDSPEAYRPPRIKVDEYVGNHLIIVSERYYDTFLSVPTLAHIDTVHRGLGLFYVCFPFVALQRPGHSSNVGCDVNYNKEIKQEWRYNGAVHNV